MANFTIEFWELLLDVVGVCVCGIAILYLLNNKFKYNRIILKKGSGENYENFNGALIQMIKQSEIAFATISDTIKRERRVLEGLIEKGEIKEEKTPLVVKESKQVREYPRGKKQKDSEGSVSGCDRYGEVVRLADSGLRVKEISERLKMPKGEVELIVKLKSIKTYSRGVA